MERISLPGRVAGPDEGIGADELALAARNHGMPLEALRYDVTPAGLHYLLIHYDIPYGLPEEWRLEVDGPRGPVSFDLGTLRRFPVETVRVTMECAGNGRARLRPRPVSQPWLLEAVGTADWTGVPLRLVLDEAGLTDPTTELVFTGADHGLERGVEQDYERSLPFAEATRPEVLLAYEMNGLPLPPQHGGPLRLIVPGWYGMAHVKWLRRIRPVEPPFDGFQQTVAYRLRQEPDEEGVPVTRIQPRALLEPPGFPDFMSRTRLVRPGPLTLRGRAWSGRSPLVRVEVSTDDGTTWHDAALTPEDSAHPWAWRSWTFPWTAPPGDHVLAVRASDTSGPQPPSPPWNLGGFANNTAHRVSVICLPS
ncbi:sulfite oxidase [Actinocorallia herbida]|uniref:sulfite oxidase n=1 Tax=Actinocorallia herbida TaxID=58109 RepID=UPI001B85F1F8|nr:sulfite oxidase [Actinocorallia herbida]